MTISVKLGMIKSVVDQSDGGFVRATLSAIIQRNLVSEVSCFIVFR